MRSQKVYIWPVLYITCGFDFVLCELCGANVPHVKSISIDGTIMMACSVCAKFGTEITLPTSQKRAANVEISDRLTARRRRLTPRDIYSGSDEEELARDYGDRIRRAREARGWKQAELGARINEKASVIRELEGGDMRPSDELIKKLEKMLEIRLKEKVEKISARKQSASSPLTLADLVERSDK